MPAVGEKFHFRFMLASINVGRARPPVTTAAPWRARYRFGKATFRPSPPLPPALWRSRWPPSYRPSRHHQRAGHGGCFEVASRAVLQLAGTTRHGGWRAAAGEGWRSQIRRKAPASPAALRRTGRGGVAVAQPGGLLVGWPHGTVFEDRRDGSRPSAARVCCDYDPRHRA